MSNPRKVTLSLAGDGEEQLPYDVESQTLDYDDRQDIVDTVALVSATKDKMMPDNQFIQDPALSDVRAMQDTTDTLRDAVEAGEYDEAIDESDKASEELQNVRDIVDVINSNEAWTPGAAALLGNHLQSISRRLGIRDINTGVDLEDYHAYSKIKQISLEDIDNVITAVDSSTEVLQERSVEALDKLMRSLAESVPNLRSRLSDLCRKTENLSIELPAGNVTLPELCLHHRLSADGKFIESFPQYVNEYTALGQKLLGCYTETAFQAAMRVNSFETNLTQYSPAGYWSLLEDKVRSIQDPRKLLTENQMLFTLPGACALFCGPGEEIEATIPIVEKMRRYVFAFKPVSIADFTKETTAEPDPSDNNTSVPAISTNDICDTIKFFCGLIDQIDVSKVSQSCKAAWIDAKRTICVVKKQLSSADDTFAKEISTDGDLLPMYLEAVFALSAWPVLNYLTNLVLFGNAFVDYATLSINPENIQEPQTQETDDSSADDSNQLGAANNAAVGEGESGQSTDGEDPALEPGEKPSNPDEVPDTGSDPDNPEDATGDGERAVVVDVGVKDNDSEGDSDVDSDGDTVDVGKSDEETAADDEDVDFDSAENDESTGENKSDEDESSETDDNEKEGDENKSS